MARQGVGVNAMVWTRALVACANTSSKPAQPPDTPNLRGSAQRMDTGFRMPDTRYRLPSRVVTASGWPLPQARRRRSGLRLTVPNRLFPHASSNLPKDASWLRGGAGSIRGCYNGSAPTTVLTQRCWYTRCGRPRDEAENNRGQLAATPTTVARWLQAIAKPRQQARCLDVRRPYGFANQRDTCVCERCQSKSNRWAVFVSSQSAVRQPAWSRSSSRLMDAKNRSLCWRSPAIWAAVARQTSSLMVFNGLPPAACIARFWCMQARSR